MKRIEKLFNDFILVNTIDKFFIHSKAKKLLDKLMKDKGGKQ